MSNTAGKGITSYLAGLFVLLIFFGAAFGAGLIVGGGVPEIINLTELEKESIKNQEAKGCTKLLINKNNEINRLKTDLKACLIKRIVDVSMMRSLNLKIKELDQNISDLLFDINRLEFDLNMTEHDLNSLSDLNLCLKNN